MAEVRLTEECMHLISQFESITGAGSRDCIVDPRNDRLIFVINPGEMGLAIGKGGSSVKRASEAMGMRVEVVEYSDNAEQFIRNCFLPARVTGITFATDENDERVAIVEVEESDRGLAIGKEGKNIFKAKRLSQRQHGIADIQLGNDDDGTGATSTAEE
ncbi:MAG: NusA-like transcription termination signal-binding factor [Methanomicrobiales archaeon]